MKLAVIGTGYVGLVNGACLAEVGHEVVCLDIDQNKIESLKKGHIPIYEPGLSDIVLSNHKAGRLRFTTSLKELNTPVAIFFALPTPSDSDGDADLSYILSAAKDVAKHISDYTVFINKSTVPVGTANELKDIIAQETDVPFDVVSNPEFLKEGLAVNDMLNANRIVVGASSVRARKVVQELYEPFTSKGVPLLLMDEASAEMTKYAANSFLATKISFMNEIANLCELVGADVDKVRQGIGSDERIGPNFLRAGIGYGGSCFPKDVLALQHKAHTHRYHLDILDAAMRVNDHQKKMAVEKIVSYMGDLKGKKLAVWGLAFKADTDDVREAPSLEILDQLVGMGALITAYDPKAADNFKKMFKRGGITYADSAPAALKDADALLVLNEWSEFKTANLHELGQKLSGKLLFDGRNLFEPKDVLKAGMSYIGIGRPLES